MINRGQGLDRGTIDAHESERYPLHPRHAQAVSLTAGQNGSGMPADSSSSNSDRSVEGSGGPTDRTVRVVGRVDLGKGRRGFGTIL